MSNEHKKNTISNSQHIVNFRTKKTQRFGDLIQGSLNSSMLIEDLHTNVIPYSYDDSSNGIELKPYSKSIEQLICNALSGSHYEKDDLTKVVSSFVRDAVHTLVFYGRVMYEIVYSSDKNNNIVDFKLNGIPFDVVRSIFGMYYQFLPKDDYDRKRKLKERFIKVDKSKLFFIELPPIFNGAKKHRKLLQQISKLTDSPLPSFSIEEMKPHIKKRYFDSKAFIKNSDLWLANATKHLGWTARYRFQEKSLEYYRLFRHLHFLKVKAQLREKVIDNLNELFETVGNEMNFTARIEMPGLHSSLSYDEKIKELSEGKLPFSKAWMLEFEND